MSVYEEHVARPVQLQINNSGAWKTICKFDAGCEPTADMVKSAVELLMFADSKKNASYRIASCDPLPHVLLRYEHAHGWVVVREAA
jgi:hypothetical protein